ncbi:hypothetical protein T12_16187 [Trichinella patagoniensis]|uniref:Uncharacterized protein n=1 Tax=Trichinella patagoniensis TaxID=990121 RepID=A0A0V0ZLK5_9BILA|nr:hypothetical protein T12_16187 [Trichinella patagoniensis]
MNRAPDGATNGERGRMSENPRWIMPPEALTRSSDVERWFIRMERYFRAADVPDNRRAAMVQYNMDEAWGTSYRRCKWRRPMIMIKLLKEQTTDNKGLRRFISRRGRAGVIQSDNFRSFKLADHFIQYLFIDSNWERGAVLTHDELHTTICEIEARINDRPIVLTGDIPSDRIALTPAHFLIGRELSRLPNNKAAFCLTGV